MTKHKLLELELGFNIEEDKKYKVETIRNSAVYNTAIENQLPRVYYLVSGKGSLEDKILGEPISAILHL